MRQNLLFRFIYLPAVFDGLPLNDASSMDTKHADIDMLILLFIAKHIHVSYVGIGDYGLALKLL